MSTSSNKPRDIKDLKARLGRAGGAPGGPGATTPFGSAPFPAGPASGSLPPPAVGGAPQGSPFPGAPGSVPEPPFATAGGSARPSRPSQPGMAPAAGPSGPSSRSLNPLEGRPAPVAAPRQVQIVIDDSAVKDSDIGRKSLIRGVVILGIGAIIGALSGYGVGNTMGDRTQYAMAVADGKQIYAKLTEVSKVLDSARASLKTALDATAGGAGKQAHIDYKAIGDLVALPKPFSAGEFSRRRYLAFPTSVVDDLFEYYNGVNLLWNKFEMLGNRTAGAAAREALDKSAQAGNELMSQDYGVVVAKTDGAFVGGLVTVRAKAEGDKPKGKDDAPVALVSSRAGSREVERKMFLGQDDFASSPDHYVIMVDKARSMGLLGGGASLFGQVRADMTDAQKLLDKLAELQGRLQKELGKI